MADDLRAELDEAAERVLDYLRALPVEQRMEAMGMVQMGWVSPAYSERIILDSRSVRTLDARAAVGDPTFRGTFFTVWKEADRG